MDTKYGRLAKRIKALPLVLIAISLQQCAATSCIDESGKPVDWYFIYKLPDGFRYAYRDSNTKASDTALQPLSDRFLNMTTGLALGDTLHQVYAHKTDYAYVLYNDESPPHTALAASNVSEDETAHAKGVLAFDGTSGFWLIHSVPKFPDLNGPDFTWTASNVFAQHFLCISLDRENIDKAAFQVRHTEPGIFASNMPAAFSSLVPNMTLVVQQKKASETSNVLAVTSVSGGTPFKHFAKRGTWGKDLYEDLVEPTLEEPFLWNTWRRKPYTEGSYCKASGYAYDSVNVMSINMGPDTRYDQWKYTRDHCKWGISQTGNWVCVGDINRMTSQKHRGGGTACFEDAGLHYAINATIASIEAC